MLTHVDWYLILPSTHALTWTRTQNPSVGSSCKLNQGQSYCVERNYGVPPPPTSTTTTPGPTSTGNGVHTPTPTQPGIASNYNKFYQTKSGDGCAAIASANGISLSDFYAWNTGVGSNCETLWADTYYCIGIIGGATTTTKPTTTTPGNGVTTPTPTQGGMTGNCNKFYQTKSGDTCAAIASSYGIGLSDFYAWNTGVGSNCESLWAGTYYCVGKT
jgi:LysM repeat protein